MLPSYYVKGTITPRNVCPAHKKRRLLNLACRFPVLQHREHFRRILEPRRPTQGTPLMSQLCPSSLSGSARAKRGLIYSGVSALTELNLSLSDSPESNGSTEAFVKTARSLGEGLRRILTW